MPLLRPLEEYKTWRCVQPVSLVGLHQKPSGEPSTLWYQVPFTVHVQPGDVFVYEGKYHDMDLWQAPYAYVLWSRDALSHYFVPIEEESCPS